MIGVEHLTLMLLAAACFVILVMMVILAFVIGKMWHSQKVATETSQIAFIAAFWACTEARGLKNSTIIQRVIEKIHPVARKSAEELSDDAEGFNAALSQMIDPDGDGGFDFTNPEHLMADVNLGRGTDLTDDEADELV